MIATTNHTAFAIPCTARLLWESHFLSLTSITYGLQCLFLSLGRSWYIVPSFGTRWLYLCAWTKWQQQRRISPAAAVVVADELIARRALWERPEIFIDPTMCCLPEGLTVMYAKSRDGHGANEGQPNLIETLTSLSILWKCLTVARFYRAPIIRGNDVLTTKTTFCIWLLLTNIRATAQK